MQIELSAERQAQLHDYAQRHGQDLSSALNDILAEALEWDRLDREDAAEGIRRGIDSLKAGHTRPASDFLKEFQQKHGL